MLLQVLLLKVLVGKEGYFMAENKDDEMFSMSYKDARDKFGVGVGSNKYFMSESDFEKGKAERDKKKAAVENKPKEEKTEPKKQQSLVANKFGDPNSKSYKDVLRENGNDPAKMAEWMNNNPGYKAGNATKEGMAGFGYIQGEDGKWAPKPKTENTTTTNATTEGATTDTTTSATTNATTDESISKLEEIMAENKKLKEQIEALQNPDGSVNKDKAKSAWDEHMQKGLEMGAVTLDKDGNYVMTNVNKKGWEDWATMLSAGASVIGLAMGVPIIPINFRKITGKDEKDKAIREFQKQLTDISAGNAAKVKDVESSAEAGKLAKANESDINAYSKYKEDVGAYEAKSTIDTDSEKELIDKNLEAEMTLVNEEFKNKIGEMKLSHDQRKDLEELMSNLSTDSAKELLNQERYGYLLDMAKDMKAAGMDEKAIALKIQSLAGNTATTQNLKHAQSIVGMIKDILEAGSSYTPWGGKKK